jgi:DNA-binding Lrp family transcriptional regulator
MTSCSATAASSNGVLSMSDAMPRQDMVPLNEFECLLINELQADFPLCPEPYRQLAERFGCEAELILETVSDLLQRGVLTRFGPLLNIEKAGGVFSLCALRVEDERFDKVAELVNAYPEVAHNYQREHDWNMWFVLAAESSSELESVFAEIVQRSECPGLNLPKEEEYYVGLRFEA